MPSDLVGLGFPPASLSIQGVLMTNPGQIDPGYRGPLHLTVINMSKDPLYLSHGQRIIRVIFAKLDAAPSADYGDRHPSVAVGAINGNMSKEPPLLSRGQRIIRVIFAKLDAALSAHYRARHPSAAVGPINDELLQKLSIDFLNVDQRASDAVKSAQLKAGFLSAVIGAVVGIFLSSFTVVIPRYFDRYYALESGLSTLGAKVDVATLKERVDRMEAAVKPATATPATALVPPPTSASAPTQAPRP
jgi:dUTPase